MKTTMDKTFRVVLAVIVGTLFVGCSPAEPEEVRFIARGVVLPEGADLAGGGRGFVDFTLTEDEVDLALVTVDESPDLAWGQGHIKFFYGAVGDAGDRNVVVNFSCDAILRPGDPEGAVEELQNAVLVDGGGDCYGFAVIDATTGELLRFGVNGES